MDLRPGLPPERRRLTRIVIVMALATAATVLVLVLSGGDPSPERRRLLRVLLGAPFVVALVVMVPGSLIAWSRRQRAIALEPVSRQRDLAGRRRTIQLTWIWIVLNVATLGSVVLLRSYDPEPTDCAPSAADPDRELCITVEHLDFGSAAALLTLALAIVAIVVGVVVLVRWRRTIGDVPHPAPGHDDRPLHLRQAFQNRMVMVMTGFVMVVAGRELSPNVTSTYETTPLECVDVTLEPTTSVMVEIDPNGYTMCSQESVEVERRRRTGIPLRYPLYVGGAGQMIATAGWWAYAVSVDKRRRDGRRRGEPIAGTAAPGS